MPRKQVHNNGHAQQPPPNLQFLSWTGKNYKKQFKEALQNAQGTYPSLYLHRVKGEGLSAEYYVASDHTRLVLQQWFKYENKDSTCASIKQKITTLRVAWTAFILNPNQHVEDMQVEVPQWNAVRARKH